MLITHSLHFQAIDPRAMESLSRRGCAMARGLQQFLCKAACLQSLINPFWACQAIHNNRCFTYSSSSNKARDLQPVQADNPISVVGANAYACFVAGCSSCSCHCAEVAMILVSLQSDCSGQLLRRLLHKICDSHTHSKHIAGTQHVRESCAFPKLLFESQFQCSPRMPANPASCCNSQSPSINEGTRSSLQ